MRILFLYPNLMLTPMVPPAIAIFSALLKERGFEVELFDTTFYKTEDKGSDEIKMEYLNVRPFNWAERGIKVKESNLFEDLRRKVETFAPDLIALSIVEDTYPLGLSMLKSIRKYYHAPVVVGGVFPTFAPEKVIREQGIDMICVGDGERAIVELCEKIRAKKSYTGVGGIWVKKDGSVIKNPLAPATNINELPVPDFSLFEEERLFRPMAGKIYKMLPVETHRGCPFQCAYCNSPASQKLFGKNGVGSFFRKKMVRKVYDEISFLVKKWNVEYIYFTADTFLAISDREFKEFAEMYGDFKLPFWIQTRPETLNKTRLRLLKEIGCHRISIGIEHGNENFRKTVVNRRVSNKDILDRLKLLEDSAIPVSINNIIGFPDETKELAFDTIMLNRKINSDTVNAYAFVPYHGTPLREVCLKKGYITEDAQTAWLTKDTILNMPQFPKEEIRGLMRTFALYTKLPESEFPRIKIAERFDEEGNRIFKELTKIYRENYF